MVLVVVAALAVLVGATLQRVSGTGVGLVVAPTLSLLLGASQGVLVTNAVTVVSGFVIMLTVLPRIDWDSFRWIITAALPGAVTGAWLVHALPAAWLQLVVGLVVLLALLTSLTLPELPRLGGRLPMLAAGLVGGLFNTTAGVAAPAMVVYARLSRWEQERFAATVQPTFMTMGALSVALKTATAPQGLSGLPPWWVLPAVVVDVLLGVWLGTRLSRHVPAGRARTLALCLAGIGGALAVAKGVLGLV
ncbi:sulfite exporter TauE/SafE family protein [Luteococcus peritonei]|uniref:Probable membrane transporter protein n=1 Tax=Luteococcus peritonei TaxID=88874 RepID=A0ABW4RYS7_9ACTN